MKKIALITGADGQDFYYLSTLLLSKGYVVYGVTRRINQNKASFLLTNKYSVDTTNLHIIYGDMLDDNSLYHIFKLTNPDEVYNLAGFSHPGLSFEQPEITINVNGVAVLKLLDIIKNHFPKTRFCQVSSPDMFANSTYSPQTEITPHCPNSPYGISKSMAHNFVNIYRSVHNIYAVNCICYNHESPKRNELFVTRKICKYVAGYKNNPKYENIKNIDPLLLGNLNARRDWGAAEDYVYGMWLALNHEKPDDYIFATGSTHSIKDLCLSAFKYVNEDLYFNGEGINECGYIHGNKIIAVDKSLFRPLENKLLVGDYSKAKSVLGWQPQKQFNEIIKEMVEYDISKH